jgi:extradiol dioxygenase family protein
VASTSRNAVDGDPVPVPHFGLALSSATAFHDLTTRMREAGVRFELEPHLRFAGKPGEQWCAFLFDPAGNAVELKAMSEPGNLFARYHVE